mgnify:FL=1
MPSIIKGRTLGKQEIADLFGVSEVTVDAWIRKGCPIIQRGSKGVAWQINSAAVSNWLRERDVENATGNNLSDEQELKRRKLAAETQKAELEMLRVKGELVPLKQLERSLANTFAELKTNMRNIPRRTATALVGETSEVRIKEVLLAEIDQCLEVLAQFTLDDPMDEDDD